MELIRQFRPALLFLGKFLAIYLVGNILYGMYIESWGTTPDPVTKLVSEQVSSLLRLTGYDTASADVEGERKVGIYVTGQRVLNVFEGCNGINVIIVFAAFLVALRRGGWMMIAYFAAGVLVIHLFNLLRIGILFSLAYHKSTHFYLFHKYFFTGILYLVVMGLWAYWIYRVYEKRAPENA